jgi:carbonic anhydrase
VLGHSNCGAVKAAIQEIQDPKPLPGHIWDITDAVRPGIGDVVKAGGDGLLERAIDANVAYNVARVESAQPMIAEAVKSGRVRVVGAEYELATGKVRLLGG